MTVIYESENFIAVDKPPGIIVHPVKKDDDWPLSREAQTVVSWALDSYPEISEVGDRPDLRPGIVHRLDRDTSGIMIVARTVEFFDYFKNLLKNRKVDKSYLALVMGEVEAPGVVEKEIGLKPGTTRQTTWTKNAKMVKEAKTRYEPLEVLEKDGEKFTLMQLSPKTGRTHQLRVHMASLHHSVVGDNRYGREDAVLDVERQLLHARSLKFEDMDGRRMHLEANLPGDFRDVLRSLGSNYLKKLNV